jgi:hypothetical protein
MLNQEKNNKKTNPEEKIEYTDVYPVGMTVREGDTIYIGTSKRWMKQAEQTESESVNLKG